MMGRVIMILNLKAGAAVEILHTVDSHRPLPCMPSIMPLMAAMPHDVTLGMAIADGFADEYDDAVTPGAKRSRNASHEILGKHSYSGVETTLPSLASSPLSDSGAENSDEPVETMVDEFTFTAATSATSIAIPAQINGNAEETTKDETTRVTPPHTNNFFWTAGAATVHSSHASAAKKVFSCTECKYISTKSSDLQKHKEVRGLFELGHVRSDQTMWRPSPCVVACGGSAKCCVCTT
jgi:hypothetical protein